MERVKPRRVSDVWRRFREDPNEETVTSASELSGLNRDVIRYYLKQGQARGRKVQIGKKEYWVVEMDSLPPRYRRDRLPASQTEIQVRSEGNQSGPETHLGRVRKKVGVEGDELTTQQAADYLRARSSSTIRHRLRTGGLKGRKVGRDWLVKKKDLDPLRYSR